jgi:hypothetical protein
MPRNNYVVSVSQQLPNRRSQCSIERTYMLKHVIHGTNIRFWLTG